MQSTPDLDRVFPLSAGSSERRALHPPRLNGSLALTPGVVLGHSAFLRAWAARRAAPATVNLPSATSQLRETAASLR